MIEQLIAEATECDFKVALEIKKPKSWLKSVSSFSNGIGGTLFFGISDDRKPIGLSDVQKDAEAISRLIKERITPLPQFILKPLQEDGKNLLALEVSPGRSTPYYYKADGVMEAYIRVGNESVIAPDYIVNELILKGTNQSFDTLTTDAVKKDYSFTLLEATYLERTGLRFEPSDYVSFGLTDKNGLLTNAGKLMTDQHTVYNSRMFCTRWNGLEKGSIFDDALDDKEYEGNLIYLLKSGSEFIRNNSKVRFVKEAQYRVDKPDYAERAVTEALVNALILKILPAVSDHAGYSHGHGLGLHPPLRQSRSRASPGNTGHRSARPASPAELSLRRRAAPATAFPPGTFPASGVLAESHSQCRCHNPESNAPCSDTSSGHRQPLHAQRHGSSPAHLLLLLQSDRFYKHRDTDP